MPTIRLTLILCPRAITIVAQYMCWLKDKLQKKWRGKRISNKHNYAIYPLKHYRPNIEITKYFNLNGKYSMQIYKMCCKHVISLRKRVSGSLACRIISPIMYVILLHSHDNFIKLCVV